MDDGRATSEKSSDSFDDDKYLPSTCLKQVSSEGQGDQKDSAARTRPFVYVSQPTELVPCIFQMKILIDRRFEHWIDALNSWNSASNTILDNIVIGAGIAGTGVRGLASQVFNALSASLTGVKSTVNNDYFYQKSVQIIITQMKTDRAKWDTIIHGRLQATQKAGFQCSLQSPRPTEGVPSPKKDRNKSVSLSSETVTENELTNMTTTTTVVTQKKASDTPILPYCSLSDAWADLESYSRQGSFNNALLMLSTNVSAQSAACQAENLNVRQASTATTKSGSPAKSADATATSPCPAPSTMTPPNSAPVSSGSGK